MTIYVRICSDCRRIVFFYFAKAIQRVSAEILNLRLKISWQGQFLVKLKGVSCCLRIVNDVSYVMRINQEVCFCVACSAYCK